jgi:hypothetical protein
LIVDAVGVWGDDVEVDVAVAGDSRGDVCLCPGPDLRRICEVGDLDAYGWSVGPSGCGLRPTTADGKNFAGLRGAIDHEHPKGSGRYRGPPWYAADLESDQDPFHDGVVVRLKRRGLSVDPGGTALLDKRVLGGRERSGGRCFACRSSRERRQAGEKKKDGRDHPGPEGEAEGGGETGPPPPSGNDGRRYGLEPRTPIGRCPSSLGASEYDLIAYEYGYSYGCERANRFPRHRSAPP